MNRPSAVGSQYIFVWEIPSLHFLDDDIEAQRGEPTSPCHTALVIETGFEFSCLNPKTVLLTCGISPSTNANPHTPIYGSLWKGCGWDTKVLIHSEYFLSAYCVPGSVPAPGT